MSAPTKTGGSAFPISASAYAHKEGMTLRDYFAAHAPLPPLNMELDEHCAYRYRYADAMLAAREAP